MNKVLRAVLAGLAGIVLVAVIVVLVLGWKSPRDQYLQVEARAVPIPTDAAAIERGRYFAHAIGVCGVCHGDDLAGQNMSDSMIWGYVFTPNLTPGQGGIGRDYAPLDWVRAIRHGVDRNGRAFAFMPVDHYYHITDEDLGDIIAYLQHLPPVDNAGGDIRLGIIPRAIINSGVIGDLVRPELMDHNAPRPEPAASRGEYLALIGGCDFCHGPTLQGGQGPEPGAPPGPDITGTGRLAHWALGDFAAVMAAGALPDGRTINPMFMPWKGYRNLSGEDLQVLFDYLRSLPEARSGSRQG